MPVTRSSDRETRKCVCCDEPYILHPDAHHEDRGSPEHDYCTACRVERILAALLAAQPPS